MGGLQSTTPSANPPAEVPAYKPKDPSKRTVLIPVDGSKHSETAFLWYMKHVHQPENIVRILHCQELAPSSPIMAEHAFRTDSWTDLMEKAREDGKSLVNKYEEKLAHSGVQGSVHFEIGKPGEVVLNAAEKFDATHIVMGSRGFGMIRRTILGSVSEFVIHHTQVPVTVVPRETQRWFF